jgi:hypothetical protein
MRLVPLFTRTVMSADCEVCNRPFDLIGGGVCTRCRRVLCARHLHGSWFRRLAVDLGAECACVECRAGGSPTQAA